MTSSSSAWLFFTPPASERPAARAASAGIDEVLWDLNVVGREPAHQVDALETLAAAFTF